MTFINPVYTQASTLYNGIQKESDQYVHRMQRSGYDAETADIAVNVHMRPYNSTSRLTEEDQKNATPLTPFNGAQMSFVFANLARQVQLLGQNLNKSAVTKQATQSINKLMSAHQSFIFDNTDNQRNTNAETQMVKGVSDLSSALKTLNTKA